MDDHNYFSKIKKRCTLKKKNSTQWLSTVTYKEKVILETTTMDRRLSS